MEQGRTAQAQTDTRMRRRAHCLRNKRSTSFCAAAARTLSLASCADASPYSETLPPGEVIRTTTCT
eukprot:3848127-Pleurochrysis_carterae.AAC.1